MTENQSTVCDWAFRTFGPRTRASALKRMMQEVREMSFKYSDWLNDPTNERPTTAAALLDEMADVVITMYAGAESLGKDLHECINEKMKINRVRKWTSHGDGTGQHKS